MGDFKMCCQGCNAVIYDDVHGFELSNYYECEEVWRSREKVKETYPTAEFEVRDGYVFFKTPIPSNFEWGFNRHIRKFIRKRGHLSRIPDGIVEGAFVDMIRIEGDFSRLINYSVCGSLRWHLPDKEPEYYEQAGIVLHKSNFRNGVMAYGCYFCEKCAWDLGFACDQCGKVLVAKGAVVAVSA